MTATRGRADNRAVRHGPGGRRLRRALAIVLVGTPATVMAQVSPTAPAHPTMPWSGVTTPAGQLIRYVYMPPQPVTLEYLVPGEAPAAEPSPPAADGAAKGEEPPPVDAAPQVVRQQVTVPGYYVRETTVGFHYPERWVIEQTGPNAYRWRMLPAQFVPK